MIIYLYGPDSYRRREKLNEYLERYKNKYAALSLSNFDLEADGEFQKLKDFIQSQSLFESSKLGVIFNIGDSELKEQKELIKVLKENLESKDLTLIINETKKPTKEFSFLLKEPAIFWEFENLTGLELQKFLEKESEQRGLILDKESGNSLCQVFGGDSWGLISELGKLALLNERKITKKVLENHLHASLPVNIFSAINRMRSSKNIGERLSLLEELLSRSEDPAMIFNILAVSPYADLKWKEKVADYDAAVKSGKLEYEEVLLDLTLSG